MIIDFEIECEEILISEESDEDNNNNDAEETDESLVSSEHDPLDNESPTKSSKPSISNHISVKPVTSKSVTKQNATPINSSTDNISTPSTKTSSVSSVPESSKSTSGQNTVASTTNELLAELCVEDDVLSPTKENTVSSNQSATTNKEETSFPKLHNIPTKGDTSEQARQLYSMIQSGSFHNFPVMQPASKNLVRQLLDIVKLANSRNQSPSNGEENIPNTYIITTKYDDPNSTAKVRLVETNEVISMVTQTVQAIKDGTYEKSDDLVIICGSPAIFLIKNVSVKSFDPNMNSVYVITTENLISYLYLLSTQPKPPRKIPIKTPPTESTRVLPSSTNTSQTSSVPSIAMKTAPKNQNVPVSSYATKIVPSKLTASVPTTCSSSTRTRPVVSTSSILPANSSLKLISSLSVPQTTSSSLTPVTSKAPSVLSVTSTNIPRVLSLPLSAITTKNVSILPNKIASGVAKSTLNSSSVTNSISSSIPSSIPSSSILVPPSSRPTSIVIPSKSSAFQAPKIAIAPLNAMRNNMASLKRKIDAIHRPILPACAKDDSSLPKSVPSVVLTQSFTTSNVITLPRTVNTTLNKTGLVKLTFAPAASSLSTLKTSQPLKVSQLTGKTQPVRSEANKVPIQFDSVAGKRKSSDFISSEPSPKRVAVVAEKQMANNSSQVQSKVAIPGVQKPTTQIQRSSPEVPSPITYDVDSDSDGERPLSPRAAQRLLANQRAQIRTLEQNIIKKEYEILEMRKKLLTLKKRCLAAKKTADSKPDEQLTEDILKKYFDNDAVQFFVGQMKMAGKTFTQFRWSEEDKLFALGLLYRNPVEYNILVQRFTLPSDKTLNKFVSRIKKAEMDANVKS